MNRCLLSSSIALWANSRAHTFGPLFSSDNKHHCLIWVPHINADPCSVSLMVVPTPYSAPNTILNPITLLNSDRVIKSKCYISVNLPREISLHQLYSINAEEGNCATEAQIFTLLSEGYQSNQVSVETAKVFASSRISDLPVEGWVVSAKP